MLEIEAFLQAVANVGFPIVVAGYLLIRLESKFDKLTGAVEQLTLAVDAFKREAKP